ncbi:hotdog fold thioesterase [Streptomyces sp. URMC 123]|uniref:hotdog fold thioesterase n=1 Tax=Streptomyces sp. URMC 123 TaxID=3423403 RepID=UPI003F1C586D
MTVPAPEATRDTVAWLNDIGGDTLAGRMGITFLEAAPHRVVATMPVAGNTQLYRMLHGGASVVLAESLGSIGAALHAGEGHIAVGVDINATHHRVARSGLVTGVATALHLGRTTATYDVVISDEAGHRLCTSRITCAIHAKRRTRDRDPAHP